MHAKLSMKTCVMFVQENIKHGYTCNLTSHNMADGKHVLSISSMKCRIKPRG